jgi:hypothetical protein
VELLQNLPRESLVKLALPIYKGGQVLPAKSQDAAGNRTK